MIGYDINWDALLDNTREHAMIRKDTCKACEHWDGASCLKWDVPQGSREPWLGLWGSCPIQRWMVCRTKSVNPGNRTRQTE